MARVVDSSFEYVSPPPPLLSDLIADERSFIDQVNEIPPGRLSVKCIEAINLRRKDRNQSKTLLNSFVRLTLGPKEDGFVQSSKWQHDVSHSPSFNNEVISFDIETPGDIVCFKANDIKLTIEVIDSNPLESFIMGKVTISAMRFFKGLTQSEWIPLYQRNDESSNSSIHLHFEYLPVKEGILELSKLKYTNLHEGQSIVDPNIVSIIMSIGDFERESSLEPQHGSKSFTLPTTKVMEYLDLNKNNWFQPLKIKVVLGRTKDVLFDSGCDDLLQLVRQDDDEGPTSIQLFCHEKNTSTSGTIAFEAKFFESSSINIKIGKAKSLLEMDTSRQQTNPYVVIRSEGRAACPTFRSITVRDGGLHPVWDEEVKLIVVDQYQLIVECYDDDLVSDSHELIGSGQLSLMPAYKTGHLCSWVDLTRINEVGATLSAGQINIIADFDDVGSKFPRFHKSNTSMKLKGTEVQNIDDVVSASVARGVIQNMRDKVDTGEHFTDEDIRSTFSLLDLDHNGYVGSAELRHVLINMGELITDEEVDTMISMLDKNGDGQVNFNQFSAMARCSDMQNMESSFDLYLQSSPTKESSKSTNKDAEHHQRFSDFIRTNNITHNDVLKLSKYFIGKHRSFISNKGSSVDSEAYQVVRNIDFETFVNLLPIQATGQSQSVFDMMDYEETGQIDIRILTLSLCSCLKSYSVEAKCTLIIDLFDGQERGINAKHINTILAGTHLKGEREVSRKAQTIVAFIQKESGSQSSHLSKEELLRAAVKFPNLFLPN